MLLELPPEEEENASHANLSNIQYTFQATPQKKIRTVCLLGSLIVGFFLRKRLGMLT